MASLRIHICFLVIFAGLFIPTSCLDHCWLPQKHVALFIFGDSLYVAGNNNYINTSVLAQSNFWPYGETFFRYPTGRFSDGRVIPDFIAEYAKLPLIPPYLHPAIHQLTDGVNFASAGAGALVETSQGFVIDLKTQLSYFMNVEEELKQKIGDAETNKLLSRAVYLFSIGSNDYSIPLPQSYFQEEYIGMVIGNFTSVIKEIYKKGGRKFGFSNLAPLGCLPVSRALNGSTGVCMEELNDLVKLHNTAFSEVLQKLESHLQGFKYSIFNIYNSANELINNPSKYGFKDGKTGCCGSGPYRGSRSCGGKGKVKEYQLCDNPSELIFFDSNHPTERADQYFAELMWSGPPNVTGPYNLRALFEQ